MTSHVRRTLNNLHWFTDQTERKEGARNATQGRRLVLEALEAGGNNYLIVLVAGLGFFTDSYILFASNAITPMLAYVYWNNAHTPSYDLSVNLATLGGCVVGMLLFGWLGDRHGRRKVYGWELLLLMAGTTGVVMSSAGYGIQPGSTENPNDIDWSRHGSMNVVSWLIWWRFVTGVGIGGDYPLSATIVSEMAPTRRRARMLAAVFAMQAFGYAAANVVALVVTVVVRTHHPVADARAIDQIWRWVIGLSLVPAMVAACLRLTIPESPRYTLDVLDNVAKAFKESDRFNNANLEPEWVRQANMNTITSAMAAEEAESTSGDKEYTTSTIELTDIDQSKIQAKDYFKTDGNWRLLAGTALSWFLLDIAFYALSLNSPKLIAKLWYQNSGDTASRPQWATDPTTTDYETAIYTILVTNSTHSLIISSIGPLIGAVLMVYFIDKINRRKFLFGSFLVLAALLVVTGATFRSTVQTPFHGVTIMLFVLCGLAFYFGANTLTFIVPAELFPTKYRATCHGISAAAGKIGSIITQVFLAYVKFGSRPGDSTTLDPKSSWLGWELLIFALPMFVGAAITWWLIPDIQSRHRQNKTLEELVFVRQTRSEAEEETESDSRDGHMPA